MIAYHDGKAGRYGKDQARKRFDRIMWVVSGALFAAGSLFGITVGLFIFQFVLSHFAWARAFPLKTCYLLFGLAEVAMITGVVYGMRLIHEPLNSISRQRVHYLTGARMEAVVANRLRALNNNWHLFNGIAMKGGGDIDHVLLGPAGLFCISTKSSKGIYRLVDGKLTLNDSPCDHLLKAQRMAMQLRHWLEARLDAHDKVKSIPFVQPVLVAPHAYFDFRQKQHNVWVASDGDLLDEVESAKAKLSKSTIDGCVAVLKSLTGWNEFAAAKTTSTAPIEADL